MFDPTFGINERIISERKHSDGVPLKHNNSNNGYIFREMIQKERQINKLRLILRGLIDHINSFVIIGPNIESLKLIVIVIELKCFDTIWFFVQMCIALKVNVKNENKVKCSQTLIYQISIKYIHSSLNSNDVVLSRNECQCLRM